MTSTEHAAEVLIAEMFRPAHEVSEGWESGDVYEHFDSPTDLAPVLARALAAVGLLSGEADSAVLALVDVLVERWEAVQRLSGGPWTVHRTQMYWDAEIAYRAAMSELVAARGAVKEAPSHDR